MLKRELLEEAIYLIIDLFLIFVWKQDAAYSLAPLFKIIF